MRARYDLPTNTLEQLPEMEKPTDSPGYTETGKYAPSNNYWKRKWAEYDAHIASLRKDIPCDPSCREMWTDKGEYEEGKDFEVKECRTWTKREKDGWGCAECCNRDRSDEDCDATYYRPKCPFCKGKGWFKEQPLFAFPIKEESPAVPLSPPVQDTATIEDYKEVLADHNRLVRELDLIINGDNAAKQASLCDIVSQCRDIFKGAAQEDELWENVCEVVFDNVYQDSYDAAPAIAKLKSLFTITKKTTP